MKIETKELEMKRGILQQIPLKSREWLGNILINYMKINWENLEEMDKFLDRYDQQKLNEEDIKKLNRPIISN
jgi:hypothetical protein